MLREPPRREETNLTLYKIMSSSGFTTCLFPEKKPTFNALGSPFIKNGVDELAGQEGLRRQEGRRPCSNSGYPRVTEDVVADSVRPD